MKSFAKTFLLLTTLTFAYNCYSQKQTSVTIKNSFVKTLLKDKWISDRILGLDPNTETYKLTKYNPKGKFVGNITQFVDSVNFKSEYTAWCGNDYFTHVSGKYHFLDTDKIVVLVETVTYTGDWTRPTEHREPKQLTFTISIDGDTLILTKQE